MRILHSNKARAAMVRGAKILARAVSSTLGPGGKIVLIDDRFGRVIATKDGVSVARAITLPDNEENMGARLLSDAALKVANECGDGTTTCVVVASDLLERCQQLVMAGDDPVRVAFEVRAAAAVAEAALWENSVPLASDRFWLPLVASTSCNGDRRVIDAVVACYDHVGTDGVVLLREGDSDRIEVELQDGFRIDKGWPGAALAPASGNSIDLTDCAILVAHRVIYDARDIGAIMEHAVQAKCSLVIVCEAIVGEAMATVVANQSRLQSIVVYPPGFDDRQHHFMRDLATWCGATIQDAMTGALSPAKMGFCMSAKQTRKMTVLAAGAGRHSDVMSTVASLELLRQTANAYDADKMTERIGRLRGKVASIAVGAPTPAEAREIKDRTEDAVNAVRVAYRDGVQPGGGVALLRAASGLGKTHGAMALGKALRAPAEKILSNAGTDPAVLEMVVQADDRWSMGCDSKGLRCSMLSFPDPTAVVVGALKAAVSTVTTLLMAETTVTNAE